MIRATFQRSSKTDGNALLNIRGVSKHPVFEKNVSYDKYFSLELDCE